MRKPPLLRTISKTRLMGLLILCLTIGAVSAQTPESSQSAQQQDTPPAEEALPAVKPELQQSLTTPPQTELPDSVNSDIREQIQTLQTSLKQRRAALTESRERLSYAESVLTRLENEYQSFELRLENAGLNLTADYAELLKQRLERLQKQSVASEFIKGIEDKLATAREEQLRLEEFEAITNPGEDARSQLRSLRSQLLRELHKAVTEHINVLNEYFNTVTTLQEQITNYQTLLQQRLFWLPSAEVMSLDTTEQLVESVLWLSSQLRYDDLKSAISHSAKERGGRIALVAALLLLLLIKRKKIKANLLANQHYVGHVGMDRTAFTLLALVNSVLLALPGVLTFSLVALLLMEGNAFFEALSKGFTAAAFIMFLLALIRSVASKDGLGEKHFHWNPGSLNAVRRELLLLMACIVPVTIVMTAISANPESAKFDDSLGRLLFIFVSIALAVFAQRIMSAIRNEQPRHRLFILLHAFAVASPIILAVASTIGYHYTALQLERNLFISICWLAFTSLLYFTGLRALSVRERRLTLKRLIEQRAAERKQAEARETSDTSGEGALITPEMPEMNLKDISEQSASLLRIMVSAVAISGLLLLWTDVIPALQLFEDITLWTIATDLEGGDPLPITLADALLSILVAAGTIMAVKNLPGTLEVTLLSRLDLQPGSGYAITTITTYLLVFLGVIVCLGVIGVQWSKLQWLIAALGVGLGFGLQEIVANFVSGIILLFERPIRVGDTVTIGGITGKVSRIRIRATTLVDWDRKEQIVPNKTFVTQDLTNWTLSDATVRLIIRVGVAYGSDVDQVQKLLSDVALSNERVMEDPAPAVFCVGLGESSINFEVWVFVKDLPDMMPLYHELYSAITQTLTDAGVTIPFPQRDIRIHSLSETSSTTQSESPSQDAPS
ncbi:Miniconductance mechanosensitive channel MscM precursor [Marinobacter litoralis]|uniref:Miniconductance mechanosensitive channel MscM n=1 Tax=Marinobacter litoralis TaxID=187981 RepID=A0A3M2RL47_9GAMM|nr:Miniconductance mechanosensitive channel MscM precursor [Marinobacter litoralis]